MTSSSWEEGCRESSHRRSRRTRGGDGALGPRDGNRKQRRRCAKKHATRKSHAMWRLWLPDSGQKAQLSGGDEVTRGEAAEAECGNSPEA
ncbi:hypothetical protein AAFF_G00430510 [Aldrovandia affinis]|uniref:Uncharacterized protein n=1 Tax=Aldrovandia affinis TaxID=143900 RepID=A0AAD7S8Y4_9TELE|nr:hypothetical protein AAFF_G00430510 [Aldrovandia affinis]